MIAVDWGTSSLRLYRLDAEGHVYERRRSEQGLQASAGQFEAVLAREIAGWDDALILLSGMVGSRGGWREVPYLPCPTGIDELAGALVPLQAPTLAERTLWIVPGISDTGNDAVPDVMRGEETQLAALLAVLPRGNHVVCLPGTHSKWVAIANGRIQRLSTAMTGELYAVLRNHSLLGKLMPADDSRFDAWAFETGLKRSRQGGGLLHHLFGVRTLGLFNQMEGSALPSYLSGLLIGHEILASGVLEHTPRLSQVHLIGNDRLLALYAQALTAWGVGVQRHPEDLAARGMHALWQHRA
ncbi:2-dehydro-3-deoxygalactonokinase [Stenotrophomonas sp. UBA7606]|uniref:2-dehydro-3-deoxygalactonokinase n=1 Tax=Stenotrophomonas sp. UBA7606 TaxID=1947559 RepID=UPI0025E4D204|nr:2-dehydro-3-deoxygalactonokinase [Stenotrophomonas sp. UBA7606]